MRFYKKQQLEMLNYTAFLLKDNRDSLCSYVPALGDIINDFLEKQSALTAMEAANESMMKKSTLDKMMIKRELVDVIMRLSGMLWAHRSQSRTSGATSKKTGKAKDAHPPVMHYTITDLNRSTADNLCRISEQVINASKKFRFLEHYGLTSGDIKDAETYYQEFKAIRNAPEYRKKESAQRNKQLATGMKACIDILQNTIDPLMRIAAKNNPELMEQYKSSRKVLARGKGRPSDAEAAYRKSRAKKVKKPESLQ